MNARQKRRLAIYHAAPSAGDVAAPAGLTGGAGGWWTLPNGDRVQGRAKAEAALAKLQKEGG